MAKTILGIKESTREGILRFTVFILLSSLIYTAREYPWAITLLSLAALYFLVTGAYQIMITYRRR